jgi:hypothetical protein
LSGADASLAGIVVGVKVVTRCVASTRGGWVGAGNEAAIFFLQVTV